jgi:hypothetical protein
MRTALFLPLALTLASCGGDDAAGPIDAPSDDSATVDSPEAIDAPLVVDGPLIDAPPAPFTLTSTAITEGGVIPVVHSCRGANTSPPLAWTGGLTAPGYALVFTDITTPANPFLHSIIWDIPGNATALPEGIQKVYMPPVPAGAKRPLVRRPDPQLPRPWVDAPVQYALVAVDVNLARAEHGVLADRRADAITARSGGGRATLTATFTP